MAIRLDRQCPAGAPGQAAGQERLRPVPAASADRQSLLILSMLAIPQAIPDVFLIEPKVFGDSRGFFYESFNQQAFEAATGVRCDFVQDNHSRSARGVLRGLHYQLPPKAQGKLVRVVRGAGFAVAVDIRKGST